MSFAKYLANSNASPSVKRILQATYDNLYLQGYMHARNLSAHQLYEYTKRSLFVKRENLNYRSKAGVKAKAPRAIQGAPPEFIVMVGPWIASLQKKIKRAWNCHFSCVYTGGVNAFKAAKHVKQNLWTILEDDISVFDSSINPELLKLEVWLCRKFGADRGVLDLMAANINTHGRTSHGIKYKVPGGRKSGDPYTSLFNTILNVLMHLFIISTSLRWTIDETLANVRMLAQGDDNALVYNSTIRIDFNAQMLLFGFKSEAKYRDTLYDLEFCSCRYYETHGLAVFAPMPGKVLSKLMYFIDPPAVSSAALIRGVALGLYPSCGFIEPIKLYLDKYLKETRGVTPIFVKQEEWKLKYPNLNLEPDDQIAVSLHLIYMWSSWSKEAFEKELSYPYPRVIDEATFDFLFDTDTAGPNYYPK